MSQDAAELGFRHTQLSPWRWADLVLLQCLPPFYLNPGAQHPLAELKLSKDLGQPGPLLQDGLVYSLLVSFTAM